MNTTILGEQQNENGTGMRDKPQAPRAGTLNKIVFIMGGLFLLIAVAAAAGLGVWSNQLNTQLAATQKQLVSMQGDYDKLKADNATLIKDLGQANSTLDQTKSDLAKASTDLKTANSQTAAQRAGMDRAGDLMTILEATFASDAAEVDAKILATGDAQLIRLWNTAVRTPNEESLLAFYQYLFGTIRSELE